MRTELTLTHGAFICDGQRAFLDAASSISVRFDLIFDRCPKTVTAHYLGRFSSYDLRFFWQNLQEFRASPPMPKCPVVEGEGEAGESERWEIRAGVASARGQASAPFNSVSSLDGHHALPRFFASTRPLPYSSKSLHILPYPEGLS
jgi:hypothetical protein